MTDITTETSIATAEESSGLLYELADVSRTFRVGGSEVRAVDTVSFTVDRGEFIAIEGPSGSGKSTMLQLLGGLDRLTSGTLKLNGKELSKLSDRELTTVRSRDIGFVFQQFNLIPTLTAIENVEAAMVPSDMTKTERKERAQQLLHNVGLEHRLHHLPTLLSGGEQQRVAIARALANRPSVILADEPTGNLDSKTADEVVGILGNLTNDDNVTVIIVTHAQDVAQRAGRRFRMRDGQFSEDS